MNDILTITSAILSGLNLIFLLRIIFNDLHEIRATLTRHLEMHAQAESRK